MTAASLSHAAPPPRHYALCLSLLLAAAAFGLTLYNLRADLPMAYWWQAAISPDLSDMPQLVAHYSLMPRAAVAILAGASLGLAGALFQEVLQNPLAEPSTLGVSAGAQLALTVGTLWFPGLLALGQEALALLGGALAALIVFGIGWKRRFAPLTIVLTGLVVSLYCASLATVFAMFGYENLGSVFLWGAGSLSQNGWDIASALLPRLGLSLLAAAMLARVLGMLALGEAARNLGVGIGRVRGLALALGVYLSCSVVSMVGVIGLIGLAAPVLARLCGQHTIRRQFVWAPLLGASLLWLTDQGLEAAKGVVGELPAGGMTALLGAPLLLVLLRTLKEHGQPVAADEVGNAASRPRLVLFGCALSMGLCLVIALMFGRDTDGWRWLDASQWAPILALRTPHAVAALAAGAMLAIAGSLAQRVTHNPMASPEVLGLSASASLGMMLLLFVSAAPSRTMQLGAMATGAFLALVGFAMLQRKQRFSPLRAVLVGVCVSTLFGTITTILLATGDPRMKAMLGWMSGSTYRVNSTDAWVAAAIALLGMVCIPLVSRALDLLQLGDPSARARGLDTGASRIALFILTALLTAAATLIVGPLSFVGLMAPHLARLIGLHRALPQLYGAAFIGAIVMVLADWLGRVAMFPFILPAGLLATLIGGPTFFYLMLKNPARVAN